MFLDGIVNILPAPSRRHFGLPLSAVEEQKARISVFPLHFARGGKPSLA
jgi:hypothetical protein